MLRVGLTGGIGSGKSTVARRVEQLGAVLVDADVIAREVVEPGTAGFEAVVAEFGPKLVTAEGALDRSALGAIVFADADRRGALNAIVHPLVQHRREELVAHAEPQAIVVEDIPLLVENELGAGFHLVMVVHAPADERVRRLVADRGMTEDDAWSRVRAQADDAARRAAADVWLDNSGSTGELLAQVDGVWAERVVPFEQNVRLCVPTPTPGLGDLVPYDESWQLQAERLVSRLTAVRGDHAMRIDHVGGTAVPGLVARDVIDLLAILGQGVEPADVADAFAEAGFPMHTGQEWDHASADPGRPATVRFVAHESPTLREALLMRDWLRADAHERETYNQWERALEASGHVTSGKYRDAKAEWWHPALARAQMWASRVGWVPGTE